MIFFNQAPQPRESSTFPSGAVPFADRSEKAGADVAKVRQQQEDKERQVFCVHLRMLLWGFPAEKVASPQHLKHEKAHSLRYEDQYYDTCSQVRC